jgi:hypothetical protein
MSRVAALRKSDLVHPPDASFSGAVPYPNMTERRSIPTPS